MSHALAQKRCPPGSLAPAPVLAHGAFAMVPRAAPPPTRTLGSPCAASVVRSRSKGYEATVAAAPANAPLASDTSGAVPGLAAPVCWCSRVADQGARRVSVWTSGRNRRARSAKQPAAAEATAPRHSRPSAAQLPHRTGTRPSHRHEDAPDVFTVPTYRADTSPSRPHGHATTAPAPCPPCPPRPACPLTCQSVAGCRLAHLLQRHELNRRVRHSQQQARHRAAPQAL